MKENISNEKQNEQSCKTDVSRSVLFDWFDGYVESLIGKKVLRQGDSYDNRYNNILITTCVCFSESKELIEKMDIHYHPYSLLSNTIKSNKEFDFYEIDKLRLKTGVDRLIKWRKEIIMDFEFSNFAESMDVYWHCFQSAKKLSKITKKYYFKIESEDIIKSFKGFIFSN